ncbi:MAG: hypothetical protein E7358_01300 [Clostridiales bacterium]|nr:hypothetical protein [Clostridiales bacterium]
MKKIAKILSLVISTVLIAVMMTACGEGLDGTACPEANEMQEKLANAGYSSVVEYDPNARVSIVTAKCDLSFKYAGKEKTFYTDWVSGDWYASEKDAELGEIEAKKVQGNLILKRDGAVVYLGTEESIKLFEHEIPATIDAGKQVMEAASYTVSDVNLTAAEKTAEVTSKYTATKGEDKIDVYYFEDLLFAANYYSKNKNLNKNKLFEKQGHFVYVGTENAVSTYKGLENINAKVDSYKDKLTAKEYNAYAYKKGMAGAVKAKKKGNSGDYDIQVAWFTNVASATEAYEYLKVLYKDNVDKNQIKIELNGLELIVGTEEAIADFKA